MDFFDSVMNKSNAIIKERLNNPFGSKQSQDEPAQSEEAAATAKKNSKDDVATPCLESTARQQHQQRKVIGQDSNASNTSNSNHPDQNNSDKNSQFASIAADSASVAMAAEAVAQKAAKGAKNIGSFIFSMANKAGQTVSQTAKQVKQAVESTSILTDFTREQQEFIKEHGGSLQTGQLPWDNCEDATRVAYIKEQILSLSQDKRNFVRSPPTDTDFKFDPQSCYPIALSLLKEDPNLNNMRYELVPKLVNEDTFWCNYFYRVSLLKQMSEKGERAKQGWSSSRSSSGEGPDEVSATTPHGTIDEPLSPSYSLSSPASTTIDRQQQKQDNFQLDSSDKASAAPTSKLATSVERQQSTTSTKQQKQYQAQELESSESRKLFAEADDLKSKLRELNIGSLDDCNDG